MEQILEALKGLGSKAACLPESEALGLISPVLEALQRVDTDLAVRSMRLKSAISQFSIELEQMFKDAGIAYVGGKGLAGCECVACLAAVRDRLDMDLSQYIRPEECTRLLDKIANHPLMQERADQHVSRFIDGMAVILTQVRASIAHSLGEKIEQLTDILAKMNFEMARVGEDKKQFYTQIQQLCNTLAAPLPSDLHKMSYGDLEQHLKYLQDKLQSIKSQLSASISTVSKMWDIMAVPASDRFTLDATDLTQANRSRLESEKKRLYDLQKERFREMLAEQEKQLEAFWDELEESREEREKTQEIMRSLPAVDTLDKQAALIDSLKPIAASHATIREKLTKRSALIQRMREFELSASDPNRLFGSSFRLLEEERFRKAAYPTLVKIEGEIESMCAEFERQAGKRAVCGGRVVLELLQEEKENRFISDTSFAFFTSQSSTSSKRKH